MQFPESIQANDENRYFNYQLTVDAGQYRITYPY